MLDLRQLMIQRMQAGAAAQPAPAPPVARLSQRLGYRPQNSRFASSPRPGLTIASLLHLEAEPLFVRLLFANDQAEPWTIDGAAVATTSAVGDGTRPLGPDGRPAPHLWRRVTFDSAGADAPVPLAEAGHLATFTMPGNPHEAGRPVHAWSDWIRIESVPRRDRGIGSLLLVRTFSRGQARFAASTGRPDPAMRRQHLGFSAEGEALGEDAAAFVPDDTLFACHGLQFIGPTPGATVLGVGDSIIHSSCTTGEMSGYAARACAMLSTARRPFSYVNEGSPGRNSIGFAANGLWAAEAFRPQAAIIQAWSRNEAWTSEAADLAFGRAMAVAEAVRRHGGAPILATAAPSFPREREAEAARAAGNARIRALGRQGWPVIDVDAIWGRGSPTLYRRRFDAGDGLHPNDRASKAAARVLAPMLDRLVARR